jgi:hypothetical protein
MSIFDLLTKVATTIGAKGGDWPPVPQTTHADPGRLTELLPNIHHAVLSVWHFALPEERALVFVGPEENVGKQRIRADLIHQLFPRATLLTERHRKASSCKTGFSRLSFEVRSGHDEYVTWFQPWPLAQLVLSEACWNGLLPADFLRCFEDTVSRLQSIVGREAKNWHHVVDAGRTLREEFSDWLHLCRRQIGDRTGRGLIEAVGNMADFTQVRNRRHREFPDVPTEALTGEEITLHVDSETIDDFLGLLQGLRCYMGNNRQLVSWLYKKYQGHQATGILATSEAATQLGRKDPVSLEALKRVYNDGFFPPMNEALRKQEVGTADEPGEAGLPGPIQRFLDRSLGSLGRFGLNKACGAQLVALAKELAEKHCVHEGRQLHYRFVYAFSASLWPEIEEILSLEAGSDYASGVGQTPAEQAGCIEAHWSIFQPERVFGVIDTFSKGHGDQPRLQRVVRVRPPAKWSGLESEAMDALARASGPCLTVVVLRQWMVRLSLSRDGKTLQSLLWDVRKQEPEPRESVQDLARTLATTAGINEERVRSVLATVLSEVSEAASEGALLIAVGNGDVQDIVKRTCMEMDSPENQMAWRNNKQLRWVDRTLLRAMLILDGATVIQPDSDREAIVRPRLVVYPFIFCRRHPEESTGFSVISWKPPDGADGCSCPRPDPRLLKRVRARLVGKGSRKHGGANIAVLLREAGGGSYVVSVSADGPIEKWTELVAQGAGDDNRA